MSDWHEHDSFWETFADYMFDPIRIESARAEVDKVIALLQLSAPATVLDLCCGVGRHSIELARRGFLVTGVDRTRSYLERARVQAEQEGRAIEFIESDMRAFSRPEAFDGAINLFTSFGYFDDPADDAQVARNVCQSLRPGASFIVDLNGKEVLAAKFQERSWNRRADGSIVLEERSLLDGWNRIESRWTWLRGTQRHEATVTLRLYAGSELAALLHDAGFNTVATYGSLAATPYDHRAERLIAVATK